MSPWLMVLLAAGIVLVIVRRFVGEPVNWRDVAAPPLILLGLGIHTVAQQREPTVTELGFLAVALLVGFGVGWLRGRTVQVLHRGPVLLQRYTKWTIAAWVVSLLVGVLLEYLAGRLGVRPQLRPAAMSVGVSMLGEAAALGPALWRHLRGGTAAEGRHAPLRR